MEKALLTTGWTAGVTLVLAKIGEWFAVLPEWAQWSTIVFLFVGPTVFAYRENLRAWLSRKSRPIDPSEERWYDGGFGAVVAVVGFIFVLPWILFALASVMYASLFVLGFVISGFDVEYTREMVDGWFKSYRWFGGR